MSGAPFPVLLVTAPVGGGKTSVAEAVGDELERRGLPHATVDIDWLCQCDPAPADDPYNHRLGVANLGAIWPNFAAAGATHLVLARVVESMDEIADYEAVLPGARITVCRLRASVETLHRRLHGRDRGDWLTWSLNRSVELAEIMERNAVGDAVVDTDSLTTEEVAAEVLRVTGWPGP
jgi:adenylylsulfate kinase